MNELQTIEFLRSWLRKSHPPLDLGRVNSSKTIVRSVFELETEKLGVVILKEGTQKSSEMRILQEIIVSLQLNQFNHSGFPKCHGWTLYNNCEAVILEKVPGRTLYDLLPEIELQMLQKILLTAFDSYCLAREKVQFVHGDFHTQNILVDSDDVHDPVTTRRVTIIDFECSETSLPADLPGDSAEFDPGIWGEDWNVLLSELEYFYDFASLGHDFEVACSHLDADIYRFTRLQKNPEETTKDYLLRARAKFYLQEDYEFCAGTYVDCSKIYLFAQKIPEDIRKEGLAYVKLFLKERLHEKSITPEKFRFYLSQIPTRMP